MQVHTPRRSVDDLGRGARQRTRSDHTDGKLAGERHWQQGKGREASSRREEGAGSWIDRTHAASKVVVANERGQVAMVPLSRRSTDRIHSQGLASRDEAPACSLKLLRGGPGACEVKAATNQLAADCPSVRCTSAAEDACCLELGERV
jgi:hypothetical protein